MTGCGKQEMIRCEYTNEAAGFTLSIDRPVEWTAKLQEGWPATETEEASPDEGIRLFRMTARRAASILQQLFSLLCRGWKWSGDRGSEWGTHGPSWNRNKRWRGKRILCFKGDFTGQGFYNITISMSQKDYKNIKNYLTDGCKLPDPWMGAGECNGIGKHWKCRKYRK